MIFIAFFFWRTMKNYKFLTHLSCTNFFRTSPYDTWQVYCLINVLACYLILAPRKLNAACMHGIIWRVYRYWCMVIRICRKLDLNLLHTSIFRKLFDAGKSWVHLVTFYVQFWCSSAAVNKKFERFSQLMSLTLIHLFLNLTNCARNEYTIVKLVLHSQHICILAGFVSLKLNFMRT